MQSDVNTFRDVIIPDMVMAKSSRPEVLVAELETLASQPWIVSISGRMYLAFGDWTLSGIHRDTLRQCSVFRVVRTKVRRYAGSILKYPAGGIYTGSLNNMLAPITSIASLMAMQISPPMPPMKASGLSQVEASLRSKAETLERELRELDVQRMADEHAIKQTTQRVDLGGSLITTSKLSDMLKGSRGL